MNVIGPFAKELNSILFPEIVVIRQSSSNCAGSSSRTVKEQDQFPPFVKKGGLFV